MKKYLLCKRYNSSDDTDLTIIKVGNKDAILHSLIKELNEVFKEVIEEGDIDSIWSINGRKITSNRALIHEFNAHGSLDFVVDGESLFSVNSEDWTEPTTDEGPALIYNYSEDWDGLSVCWLVRALP